MAATMTPKTESAVVLPFRKPCASVTQTDRKHRLPTLSSAEIEDFFDHALNTANQMKHAA